MLGSNRKSENKIHVRDDRVLKLTPKEGFNPKDSMGVTDPRLFTGDNKLHAIKDHQVGMWILKYEMGVVPPPFKQHFTSYNILYTFVQDYYRKRNVDIQEVFED